ncbi:MULTISPECIES: type II toxin-antitoxin system RelE/ParE family toxin [unclassified Actinomyces]|uniref:type II toxin-antitoxin system RelE family toxin n=1 Tax=unclassified Actinomyces TaxID=2609248 RepID=UPI001F3FB617|nr:MULTISPECIES: type II toxin-antitoxin system RelE/ParE family toxin [unclassified Actinomyces]
MPYAIALAARAKRDLRSHPEKVVTAVVEFLYGPLRDNPYRVGKPLRFELAGLHSARRGDYRIIYRIDDDARRVVVVTVDHRSDGYR